MTSEMVENVSEDNIVTGDTSRARVDMKLDNTSDEPSEVKSKETDRDEQAEDVKLDNMTDEPSEVKSNGDEVCTTGKTKGNSTAHTQTLVGSDGVSGKKKITIVVHSNIRGVVEQVTLVTTIRK